MSGPLRVLHVVEPVEGGAARVVAQLATAQAEAGWAPVVACPDGGVLAGELAAAGVPHRLWRAARGPLAATPGQVRALARLVAGVDPEAVHLHSASAGLTGRLALRGRRPTLFQPHGWSWQAVTGAVRAGTVAWERAAHRWDDVVVCVSADERAAGERHGVRGRLEVVPNGVDLARFPRVDAAGRDAARSRLGLPSGPLVVCVGRLTEQKGHRLLLDAWPGVLAVVPAARLAVVGDGPERAALEARAAGLGVAGSVLLAGARDDVADWYAAADVVAFASLHGEAMALTPLEAQASARSVVATDVAGVRDSLGPGSGEVVPPRDLAALAGALSRRLRDPELAEQEGRAGRRHAEAHLSVARTAERVAELTAAVVTARRQRV